MSETTIGIIVGLATLAVTGYVAILATRSMRREGTAELQLAQQTVLDNPQAPRRGQPKIDVHNRGPATGHAVVIWLDAGSGAPTRPPDRLDYPSISSGAGGWQRFDYPAEPAGTVLRGLVSWKDKRGVQIRDTGARFTVPEEPTAS